MFWKKNNILPSLGVEWNADYCVIFENEFRLDIFLISMYNYLNTSTW